MNIEELKDLLKNNSVVGRICFILATFHLVMSYIIGPLLFKYELDGLDVVVTGMGLGIIAFFLGICGLFIRRRRRTFAVIGLIVLVPSYPDMFLSMLTLLLYGWAFVMGLIYD